MSTCQSQTWFDKWRDLWCKLFHDEPMWPVAGQYQCRRCLRYHPVCWRIEAAAKDQLPRNLACTNHVTN